MNSNVTNRQIFFILFLTLTSYSAVIIAKDLAGTAGTGAWIPILVMSLIFAIGASVIVKLNTSFPGKCLFEYSKQLVGNVGSYILAIFYFLYFLMIVVFLVSQLSSMLQWDFFPKSPLWAFLLWGIPVFCYCAYKGITNVARVFEIYGIIFLFSMVFLMVYMSTQSDVQNALPLFDASKVDNYIQAIRPAIFPFLGIEVLLVIPMTVKNGKKAVKTAFFTLLFIGLFYVLLVEASIMRLGVNNITHYKDALIAAIRNIEFESLEFFNRLDIVYLIVGFSAFYMGIIMATTVMTEYAAKIFSKARRGILVTAIGVVLFVLVFYIGQEKFFEMFVLEVGLYMGLIAGFVIPMGLLLIAKVKKHAL